MDELVKEALRQGFVVETKANGAHIFHLAKTTITVRDTPGTREEWHRLLAALKGAGLNWPQHRALG